MMILNIKRHIQTVNLIINQRRMKIDTVETAVTCMNWQLKWAVRLRQKATVVKKDGTKE